MMKSEFEARLGRPVPGTVYDRIERRYMANDSEDKDAFVARAKKEHMVEQAAFEIILDLEDELRAKNMELRQITEKKDEIVGALTCANDTIIDLRKTNHALGDQLAEANEAAKLAAEMRQVSDARYEQEIIELKAKLYDWTINYLEGRVEPKTK